MTTLTLKIDSDLKKSAQEVAQEVGVSLSSLVKMLLKNVVRTGHVDIETKPRYHTQPEPGDLVHKNLDESLAYFKKLADEDGDMEEDI